jgi:hypothetical protein
MCALLIGLIAVLSACGGDNFMSVVADLRPSTVNFSGGDAEGILREAASILQRGNFHLTAIEPTFMPVINVVMKMTDNYVYCGSVLTQYGSLTVASGALDIRHGGVLTKWRIADGTWFTLDEKDSARSETPPVVNMLTRLQADWATTSFEGDRLVIFISDNVGGGTYEEFTLLLGIDDLDIYYTRYVDWQFEDYVYLIGITHLSSAIPAGVFQMTPETSIFRDK